MAEKKFFVDINLQGNKLVNPVVGSNGSMTTAGSFQYNAGRLEYYNGSTVEEVANLTDIAAVTGGLILQGGYDAATNTPDIAADSSVLKGFFWVVTAAGSFLGEAVQVGDSIIAKQDNPGATAANWLILQGNVVIATDSVDGISRLATQTEANDGTEGGAVVITPATLQGKIDAQITPEINSKVSKSGDTMSGNLNMDHNDLTNVGNIHVDTISSQSGSSIMLASAINAFGNIIKELPAPTNGGDATNKTYVDDQDALKVSKAGDTMSGNLDMGGHNITNVGEFTTGGASITYLQAPLNVAGNVLSNLGGATENGDATNKLYVDTVASYAQTNAEAYADSLAPNYDAAGAASTAESNANDYTDNEIAATRYSANIQTTDWTVFGGDPANGYIATITHNLNCYYPVIQLNDDNTGYAVEMATQYNNLNETNIFSNFIPSGLIVATLIKAAL